MFGFGKSRELNLIPEEERKQRTRRIRVVTLLVVGFVLGMQVLSFVGITLLEQIEKRATASLEEELAEKNSEWQQIAGPAEQIKVTKNKLSTYNSFITDHVDPNSKISKVQKFIPGGVTLTNLSIVEASKVSLEGEASKPEVIYQLYNTLQDREEDFDAVKLVGMDKTSPNNYVFIIGLTLK